MCIAILLDNASQRLPLILIREEVAVKLNANGRIDEYRW